jgi:hypothetical protein
MPSRRQTAQAALVVPLRRARRVDPISGSAPPGQDLLCATSVIEASALALGAPPRASPLSIPIRSLRGVARSLGSSGQIEGVTRHLRATRIERSQPASKSSDHALRERRERRVQPECSLQRRTESFNTVRRDADYLETRELWHSRSAFGGICRRGAMRLDALDSRHANTSRITRSASMPDATARRAARAMSAPRLR